MHDLGRWVKATVIVASVAALIGSCASSDDSEPATLPDTTPSAAQTVAASPSPDATTSQSPTPTADPTAALEAELDAFIRAYETTLNDSWSSDDSLADRRAMFSDDCEICVSGYQMVRDARENNLVFEGAPSQLLEVDVLEADQSRARVLTLVDVPGAKLVDSTGETTETFPPSPNIQIVYDLYRSSDQGWLVVRVEVL